MIGEEPRADEPKPDLRDHERECMDQGDVKHVKEERHASEKGDSASESPAEALNEWNQSDDGAQRHQQKGQRGWILGGVQERKQRRHRRRAVPSLRGDMPWTRISVQVKSPQNEEESYCGKSDRQAQSLSLRRFQDQSLAEGITRRRDADPRNDRIQHDEVGTVGAKLDGPGKKPT